MKETEIMAGAGADITVDRQIACAKSASLPGVTLLECWVAKVLEYHPRETRRELTIRFVEPEESQALNRDYRGKDCPTNVLSFPFEMPPGLALPLLGDLVICDAVVGEEARAQGKALEDHYTHMVVHGTLHLLGYDHIDDGDAEVMESLETRILAALGVADPYHHVTPDFEDKRPHA
ncbi:rRNA maturation RNase YbeY [Pistricoccus aurantiacus]|nr:rRNA maturation RNase YbeY [Pistricoccus aurantiacus]